MTKNILSKAKLKDGNQIPYFGLGVYQSEPGAETFNAVLIALKTGYRLIDTAKVYGNEEDVGSAICESGISREEIFVTTKLWNDDHGYASAMKALETSLKKLKLEYVDLYLIHWPVSYQRLFSWQALIELQKKRSLSFDWSE